MKIVIVGTGYVGLVSGTCFSEFGFNVCCIDKDVEKIENLKKGIIPIYEPGLENLVQKNSRSGRLTFSTNLKDSVSEADIVFIAVGTPHNEKTGAIDLSYVYSAASEIAEHITPFTLIVTKSTVSVGTGKEIEKIIKKNRPELISMQDFDVASNPEFLREGAAIDDFMRPDRVVVGTQSTKAKDIFKKLYRPLSLIETPIVYTTIQTAEMVKYASNAFLATKITFINQIANLCEKMDADVQDVAKGIGLDSRIGGRFLDVGPGYGGSCFPKDTKALSHLGKEFGTPLTIVDTVIEANQSRMEHMALKVLGNLSKKCDIKRAKLAVLGITFKADTDDIRDAPSQFIIPFLLDAGININIYDPMYCAGEERIKSVPFYNKVNWSASSYESMKDADAVLILTEWKEFRALDLKKVHHLLKPPAMLIDFRNIYKNEEMNDFIYISLGRPHNHQTQSSLLHQVA